MRFFTSLFNNNAVLKLASFNAVHIGIRLAAGIFMSKLVAYYIGAGGMAVMGNLRNFVQGAQSVSMLGLENGLVKHTAQYKDDKKTLSTYISTAWIMSLVASFIVGIIIYYSASWLDLRLINYDFSAVTAIKTFALMLPFYVAYVFVLSLFQGFEYYKKFVNLNILVSILVFAMSAWLIYRGNLIGGVYSIVLTPFVQFLVAVGFLVYLNYTKRTVFQGLEFNLDWESGKNLLSYSVMALVSAILIPLVNIAVREKLRLEVDDFAAGFWEAMIRISGYYMLFVTSLIGLYILPQLSKDSSFLNYRLTINSFFRTILPLVILGMGLVYYFREIIIVLLFTTEFEPMAALFKWQLVGDFIKVITTVLAFRFIALNDIKRYLIAEFISLSVFLGLSFYLIPDYGEEGVVMAHAFTYMIYFVVLIILLRKDLFASSS